MNNDIINSVRSFIHKDEVFLKGIRYNADGYYVHKRKKNRSYKVSVIIPVYNAENSIEKAITSLIRQTIGFENIELIIVDDYSTDKSRQIILEYARKYDNITPVFLEKNSGSPAKPRNIGISLSEGKYLTFLDSDDWFHDDGIKSLYDLLEKTQDPYAVGKSIKLEDNVTSVAGEYASWRTRESIDPFTIPRLFYHLGPTGRMMRTNFIKENQIAFPEMNFAEDKQFFVDVLTKCSTISTSDRVIYFINRYKENISLVSKTNPLEKFDANLKVIKYIKSKKLPVNIEKMALNRFYEIDGITRLFDRGHFLKSKEKEKYYEKFQKLIETTSDLPYDFTDSFFHSWHKSIVKLFEEKKYDELIKLIEWSRNENIKDYEIINDRAYYILPISTPMEHREISLIAIHNSTKVYNDNLLIRMNIYGKQINTLNCFTIRSRSNHLNEFEYPLVEVDSNTYEVTLPLKDLAEKDNGLFSIYIKYNGFERATIRMNARRIINSAEKKLDFYVTMADNFGLNIK
ncbi:glycosyltransferase family 2 protein [Bhargavaea beijingensis]|uniref:Glycosyltransferase family 2 protein n=1 Tax=Bhargavaea beijingensis TaxID=426756 RepID=A0A1G6ZXP8_9BACL|nr:glycosyltransferase family 2 protein [Bhargavaea beijingensis]RSK35677.1 glycosyltransferase family 2 protein [Bhargavaea beijingensis]SDE06625.1 Glycosyltransferase involved in cell wall bisynthesis [Bhargavaea beijingensis]